MRKVVPHLAVLEQHDVEQVGGPTAGTKLPPGAPPEVAAAAGAIFALGPTERRGWSRRRRGSAVGHGIRAWRNQRERRRD